MKPLTEREALRHTARVFLTEARRRKGSDFSKTLIQWARNARRRALTLVLKPKQWELF
jgi:hypothetical protein